ncbi:MAG: DUF4093 domain-containing protein [Oscillospiraceae bacterium]|nr:DUF4093 domain-containing protein [Oscillospiraceae bacterium]
MFYTSRAVIVEGKYDKIRLSSFIDALIIETDGFGIFSDKEKREFIKKTAREKGLIVITDSDAAGFKIRNYILNLAKNADIINVYIPDVFGKEKRKAEFSKEGKIGVEGMSTAALEEALKKSGFFEEKENSSDSSPITNADLFEAGFTGGENSAQKRRDFLSFLGLPSRLTGQTLIRTLNSFLTRDEFFEKIKEFCGEIK